MDSLGDRMKRYESVSGYSLPRKMPVIVRVDGRAFHTFTQGFDRPFDKGLMEEMVSAALALSDEMQGFRLAYIQSDEASFWIDDRERIESEPWFGNDLSKIISLSASIFSSHFGRGLGWKAIFDSRAFVVPREEVANYFLWRAKDWHRNSIQMYARSVFSHKQLIGKSIPDMHEMLFAQGKNWVNLEDVEKNGTFIEKDGALRTDVLPNYFSVSSIVHRQDEGIGAE